MHLVGSPNPQCRIFSGQLSVLPADLRSHTFHVWSGYLACDSSINHALRVLQPNLVDSERPRHEGSVCGLVLSTPRT